MLAQQILQMYNNNVIYFIYMGSVDTSNMASYNLIVKAMNQVNQVITNQNNVCPPDSECGIQKQKASLYKIYTDAKYQLSQAPQKYKTARKNYIVYTEGQDAYDQLREKEIEDESQTYVQKKNTDFIAALHDVVTYASLYSTTIGSIKYVDDVYVQIKSNNNNLNKLVNDTEDTILTNERKSFYEKDNYDSLKWWYKCWLYIYIILLIAFVISIFITESSFSFMTNMGILLLFILYIFITKPIIMFLAYLIQSINTMLPKNVYLSLY